MGEVYPLTRCTALPYIFILEGAMNLDFLFFFETAMLGVGLAMDAFSVSLANGLNEPKMPYVKIFGIAALFAIFQAAMPMIGWFLVTTMVGVFGFIEVFIPWIALGLLAFIGGKMLIDGIHECRECKDKQNGECECEATKTLGFGALIVQAIATSIDALSVGFTLAEYDIIEALIAVAVIAIVTLGICLGGVLIGRCAGDKLAGRAGIFGGAILIFIGLEIFITSWF